MANQQHPITPPPELVEQWSATEDYSIAPAWMLNNLATRAAQWGADQELEACIDWISVWHGLEHPELLIELLRAARRPKPPSLKEQALAVLEYAELNAAHYNILLRALEQLPE